MVLHRGAAPAPAEVPDLVAMHKEAENLQVHVTSDTSHRGAAPAPADVRQCLSPQQTQSALERAQLINQSCVQTRKLQLADAQLATLRQAAQHHAAEAAQQQDDTQAKLRAAEATAADLYEQVKNVPERA